jgi:hypothetical protein
MIKVKLNNNTYKEFIYNFKTKLHSDKLKQSVEKILLDNQDNFELNEEYDTFVLSEVEVKVDSKDLGIINDFFKDSKLTLSVVFDTHMTRCKVTMYISYNLQSGGSNGIRNTYMSDDLKTFSIH